MKKALVVLALFATPAFASITVRRSPYNAKTIDVYIVNEHFSSAAASLEMYLPKRVDMFLGEDPIVTYRAKEVAPEKALRALAVVAKVELTNEDERYLVTGLGEPKVNIDVKDADIREILLTMKRQCGIRNMLIDPQVQGSGTFILNDVPCRQAFNIVLRTQGLQAETYSNDIVSVANNKH